METRKGKIKIKGMYNDLGNFVPIEIVEIQTEGKPIQIENEEENKNNEDR